jgi:hypothetical protein
MAPGSGPCRSHLWQAPYGAQEVLLPLVRLLMMTTALVLFLILANLVSLLLARATTRVKELAIRQALGATARDSSDSSSPRACSSACWVAPPGAVLAVWGVQALRLVPI